MLNLPYCKYNHSPYIPILPESLEHIAIESWLVLTRIICWVLAILARCVSGNGQDVVKPSGIHFFLSKTMNVGGTNNFQILTCQYLESSSACAAADFLFPNTFNAVFVVLDRPTTGARATTAGLTEKPCVEAKHNKAKIKEAIKVFMMAKGWVVSVAQKFKGAVNSNNEPLMRKWQTKIPNSIVIRRKLKSVLHRTQVHTDVKATFIESVDDM